MSRCHTRGYSWCKIKVVFFNFNFSFIFACFGRFARFGGFVSAVSLVSAVSFHSFRSFRWFRFGRFVSLFRVLVHAHKTNVHSSHRHIGFYKQTTFKRLGNFLFTLFKITLVDFVCRIYVA